MMRSVAAAALLHLCLCATASVSVSDPTEPIAAPGDIVLLPCYTSGNETPELTTWVRDGREVGRGGGASPSPPGPVPRLSVLHDGSLNIRGVIPGDEGSYLCSSALPGNRSFQARVRLQVAEPPFPEGEPLATALEATSVTLTCTEATSFPPANTTWRKGLQQDDIVSGAKYVVSEDGPELKLTIVNVSKDDEGYYFCRSENPLAIRELEVYLTVKTASSAYTGAIIGVFIAALIVGSAIIVAKTVYSSRHRVCLGSGFGQLEEDGGDVLSLVESDDEQIFQDAVPRLPPVTNGRHTTLVQIHRIPSSDHEDLETAETSSQQQEDTVQTEEPEDLVTF
ncbi:V-set and immunoglobulin domain-containing protein 10 [Stegastes partitus]|uniref:V-set and immunoglobulin domain-containing protein 10 n=1 Tax=Stegastes partitus TaxID=144197 RepID=UPI0004950514|nr:PREDICTED: V-set and immunoglobulin domain-containing protein 10 [Stegastes partitus]